MPATAAPKVAATPVAAMAAPTTAATASHAICGSRHAGDCNTAGCRDSSRCHGSSHKCCRCQPSHLWEPAGRRLQHRRLPRLQSLPWQLPQVLPLPAKPSAGAGTPATAAPKVAATPVAAMAAPTASKCCRCQPCHLWEPACRLLQHRRLPRLQSLPWQLPQLASAATASHALCGSRHAGDCNTAGRRDSSRCHGRSHS